MKNILLTIEYDGTNFSGWQKQLKERSVQGELERVLSFICNQSIKINGTSRTDAGVHAYGQRASFKGNFGIPVNRIQIAANNLLEDIYITEVNEMPLDFHARFDALGKKYIYKIINTERVDIFKRNYYYQIPKKLDVKAMQAAACFFIGTHDFKSFQASGGKEMETTVRTIYDLKIIDEFKKNEECTSRNIRIEIIGDGFLYNMVRIITGTLIDVGVGKLDAEEVLNIIEGKDRQRAGHTAPPQGLYLAEVYYDKQYLNETSNQLID